MTAPHLGPGHTIAGKYEVASLLGFTGEAGTYHASGPRGEHLVVKLFDPAIGQRADVMSRLEQVYGQLVSLPEGAVRVVDSGYDTGTGAPFSVTEMLSVPSLASLCHHRGPQSPQVVGALLSGLAHVLDAAHAAGLGHHALKPSNIFLVESSPQHVYVTDFGAAIVRSTSPTHEAYARSAPWWAPEQLNPSAVLGPATDVFAAALCAFYALTGRSFWLSCQSDASDLQALQAEVMAQRPVASQRARELGCHLDPALDVVFERALALAQDERPQSIREMAHAVLSLLGYAGGENAAKTLAFPDEGYDAAASAQQTPAQQASAQQAPAQSAPAQQAAGQAPTEEPPVQPSAAQASAHAAGEPDAAHSPGLPPIPLEPKKKKSPVVPIVIGVLAAVALGAGGVAFLFLRSGEHTKPASAAKEESSAATSAAADDAGKSKETEAPSQGEDGTESAAGGAAPSESDEVDVTIRCLPGCDEVYVDSERVEDLDDLKLEPGTHDIRLEKAGYYTRKDTIEVAADGPFEKKYRLGRIQPRPKPEAEPCGQFLKPCK